MMVASGDAIVKLELKIRTAQPVRQRFKSM